MSRCIPSIFFVLIFVSCARVHTIGLKEVPFSKRPDHIIWMQVPGLTAEQLAILRFGYSNINEKTSFESATCISQIWSYNLFKLRPSAYEGFLSQMTGSRNIKNECSDFLHKPLWSYLEKDGFKPVIFETGVTDDNSIVRSFKCDVEGQKFRENITLFRMNSSSNPNARIFHYQERSGVPPNGIYYDKSCSRGVCYAKSISNIDYLWNKYSSVHPRVLLIIRNFKIKEAILRKDMVNLKIALDELEKTYRFLSQEIEKKGLGLLLLTTSEGKRVELPLSGKKWDEFERTGKNTLFKRSSLMSIGLAKGALSENFCGFYEDAEVLKRILWSTKKQRPFFFN